jgi:WD40-like Beta Propeller Repeat
MQAASLLLALTSTACGSSSLPSRPELGYVRVTVASTGGDLDADGYTVALDAEQPRTLDGKTAVIVETFSVASGNHDVTLGGVAANCAVTGASSRAVSVAAGGVAEVTFDVACLPTGLTITTRTTGIDRPDDYRFVLNDQPAVTIAAGASQAVGRLAPGSYTVILLAPAHCTVAGGGRITVNVAAKTMTPVVFDVACVPAVRPERIAYVNDTTIGGTSERWIGVVNVDGTGAVMLRPGDAPAWSADRTRLVFTSTRCVDAHDDPAFVCAGRLELIDPETGNVGALTGAIYGLHADWARSNGVIALDMDAPAVGDDRDLGVLRLTSGVVATLPIPGPRSKERPAMSPDGARIVFVCKWDTTTDLCIVNADGTGLARLTNDAEVDGDPAWSPNGTTIAFTRYPAGRTDDASADLVLMNLTTGRTTTLTKGLEAAWSPDGSRLVFSGGDGLFVIGADGANRKRLTTGAHRAPGWRP